MSDPPRAKPPGMLRRLRDAFRRLFRRHPERPEDPYAYVMAPKKPRPSGRSAAAVADLPDEDE